MKLFIDIGNTNTSMVILHRKRFVKHYFIHTSKKEVSVTSFKRLLAGHLADIEKIVIVSVVPDLLALMKKNLKRIAPSVPVLVVGEDIEVPMKNRYKNPKEVGQDRLVTSFAASNGCKSPVIAVDFGTALTMDFVNSKGEYEGGLIFPGLRLAMGTLTEETALLPKVRLKTAKGFIGRDTRASMNNGILFGYAAMCDGLIRKFREKYGKGVKVVATGGDAELVAKHSCCLKTIYPDLIFEGLQSLSE